MGSGLKWAKNLVKFGVRVSGGFLGAILIGDYGFCGGVKEASWLIVWVMLVCFNWGLF